MVDDLQPITYDLARRLAVGPARAHGLLKQTFHGGLNQTLPELLNSKAKRNAIEMTILDHQEGIGTFSEKREANFVR